MPLFRSETWHLATWGDAVLWGDTVQQSLHDMLDEASEGISDPMEETFETNSMLSICLECRTVLVLKMEGSRVDLGVGGGVKWFMVSLSIPMKGTIGSGWNLDETDTLTPYWTEFSTVSSVASFPFVIFASGWSELHIDGKNGNCGILSISFALENNTERLPWCGLTTDRPRVISWREWGGTISSFVVFSSCHEGAEFLVQLVPVQLFGCGGLPNRGLIV
jgi:hypothetical protein